MATMPDRNIVHLALKSAFAMFFSSENGVVQTFCTQSFTESHLLHKVFLLFLWRLWIRFLGSSVEHRFNKLSNIEFGLFFGFLCFLGQFFLLAFYIVFIRQRKSFLSTYAGCSQATGQVCQNFTQFAAELRIIASLVVKVDEVADTQRDSCASCNECNCLWFHSHALYSLALKRRGLSVGCRKKV